MNYLTTAAAALFVFVLACGEAMSGQQEKLVTLCEEQLNAPDEICNCIGETAGAELTSDEQRMVIAMITGDQETADALRSSLSIESIKKSGIFIASTPGRCAREMQSAM